MQCTPQYIAEPFSQHSVFILRYYIEIFNMIKTEVMVYTGNDCIVLLAIFGISMVKYMSFL